MLRIAVCDDDTVYLNVISQIIRNEVIQYDPEAKIETFSDGLKLISFHKAALFDLIFLDIDMPEFTGFDTAEFLNSFDTETLIIFVTAHDELVYSSLKFHPYRFLRKTHFSSELHEAVNSAFTSVNKRIMAKKIHFQTKNGDVFINLENVMYFDIYSHTVRIHTANKETIECIGTLNKLEERFSEFDFVRTHKSYLVNCKYIYAIQPQIITLDDRSEIPLSRYKSENVKAKYREYLRRT